MRQYFQTSCHVGQVWIAGSGSRIWKRSSNQVEPGSVVRFVWGCSLYVFIDRDTKRPSFLESNELKSLKGGHPRNTQSASTLAHILVTSVVLLLVSAVLHLAFALALYVLLIHNMSVPSKRKIATTKNQSTDTMRCALNPVGQWPSAWNINLSQKLFAAFHPLQCFVTVHSQSQTPLLLLPQTEMNLVLVTLKIIVSPVIFGISCILSQRWTMGGLWSLKKHCLDQEG